MPKVIEYSDAQVVTGHPSDGLLDVARRMRDEHVGCVVVVPNEKAQRVPIGMLTDRDIVVGVLAQTDRQLQLVRVDDVMSANPICALENDDLSDTLTRMKKAGVRRVPVVRSDGTLCGVLSFDDLVDYVQDEVSDLAGLLEREQERELERRARTV